MPDHSCLLILILDDELELVARPGIFTGGKQRIGSDQPVAPEEPVILGAPRVPRRTVARHDAAANPRVTHPRLIESDLCPRQCPIYVLIGSVNQECMALQFCIMRGSLGFHVRAMGGHLVERRCGILLIPCAGGYIDSCNSRAVAGCDRPDGKGN